MDEGSFTSDLVRVAEQSGSIGAHLTSYVDRLVANPKGPGKIAWRRPSESGPAGIESRETDILTLIAGGLSNKEIARSLYIGPETVKSHLKSVFTKLGVERRAQAVSRAQTLGLVTTQ